MSSGPQVFEELESKVEDLLSDFLKSFNDAVQKVVDMLNGLAGSIGDRLSHINPFDNDTIEKAIDKWNNDIAPNIGPMIQKVFDQVWNAVGDLAGRPLSLIEYAKAFNTVKGLIYHEGDLTQKMVIFQHDWKGYAADNYKTVATTEDTALLNLSKAFDAGGTMTMGVANQILHLWEKLVGEFLGWTSDLLDCFKEASSADSIITFEVPTMFEAAKYIWQEVIDLGTILGDYIIDQATTSSNNWQQLATGAAGLPENKWPVVEEGNSDAMNNPGNWEPQSA